MLSLAFQTTNIFFQSGFFTSSSTKNKRLIDLLLEGSDDDYDKFVKALDKSGQSALAEKFLCVLFSSF